MPLARNLAACLLVTLATLAAATSATATENQAAPLVCTNGKTYSVTGWGRGNALHLTDSSSTFVMTYLQVVSTGAVLADARGQEGRNDILTCTAHSPATDRDLYIQGFFTSRNG
jgi:hypothetical protein